MHSVNYPADGLALGLARGLPDSHSGLEPGGLFFFEIFISNCYLKINMTFPFDSLRATPVRHRADRELVRRAVFVSK